LESDDEPWDIVVIGGGATGVGVAVDGAARGYRVALLEQHDFGKGTSSRSTKLTTRLSNAVCCAKTRRTLFIR
jgi:glycerol-3-phosphate dehydrogenase